MKGGGFGPRTHMQLTPQEAQEYMAFKLAKAQAEIKRLEKLVVQLRLEKAHGLKSINPHQDEA